MTLTPGMAFAVPGVCFSVVPKLCLGMRPAKLCLANLNRGNESGIGREGGEAKQSFAVTHSQAELGNDRRGAKRRFARRIPKRRLGTTGDDRNRAPLSSFRNFHSARL